MSDTRQSKMDAFFRSTPTDDSNFSYAKKRKIATSIEITTLSEPEEGDEPATDRRVKHSKRSISLEIDDVNISLEIDDIHTCHTVRNN
jgi:hypothetical protein